MRLLRPCVAAISLALSIAATSSALAATEFAKIEVKLNDAKLVKKAATLRTLYISLYDANSPAPRPFGAIKVDLSKDVGKGVVYSGTLTSDNVMLMTDDKAPNSLRIKARLDKDGSAGPDEAGDLVGIVDKIKLGAKTTIVIDKAL